MAVGIGSLVGAVIGLAIGSLIGGVLLRAAVGLWNRMFGTRTQVQYTEGFTANPPPGSPISGNPISGDPSSGNPDFGQPAGIDPSTGQPAVNPYAAPAIPSAVATPDGGRLDGVPEPDFGRAVAIAFVAGILTFIVQLGIGLGGQLVAPGDVGGLIASLLNLAASIVITILVFQKMLPTTLGRAAAVFGFYMLIALAIAMVLFGIVMLIGAVA